jgi:hypothetical protein
MFCARCAGTGEIMGNGMIALKCSKCSGSGKYTEEINKESQVVLDKRSKAYKDAIKEIKAVNPNVSEQMAVKLFDDAFNKS